MHTHRQTHIDYFIICVDRQISDPNINLKKSELGNTDLKCVKYFCGSIHIIHYQATTELPNCKLKSYISDYYLF